MADSITFRVENASVIERLRQISARVGNMDPAMRAIGKIMAESTRQRFSSSTAPDGQRWARHAASTVLARLEQITSNYAAYSNIKTRKEGLVRVGDKRGAFLKDGSLSKKSRTQMESFSPLIDTGQLQDSIHSQVAADGNSVEIGTNRFYGEWEGGAAVHHFGSKNGDIPARPFLGISDSDRVEVLEILDNFMGQALGK